MKEEYNNKAMGADKIVHKRVYNFPKYDISFSSVSLGHANKQLVEFLKGRSNKSKRKVNNG